MLVESRAETGIQRQAAAPLPHLFGNMQAAGLRSRTHAGRFGMLWLTALTFSLAKHAQAADPGVTFLDDGNITYKDLEHGSFELVTKEAVPRHFLVEDPGQTIVLRSQGSSVSITQTTNSAARMAELQAAQQDALSTYEKGFGSTGSSTPPPADHLEVQPINFIQNGSITPAQNLPVMAPMIFAAPPDVIIGQIPPPPPTPPVLNAILGPTEIDTNIFDVFTATSGTFSATSSNGAPLTFGIQGGTPGNTVIDGVTFDVSEAGQFGTLYVASSTGEYTFIPNDDAINALVAPTTTEFTITVSDGRLTADEVFTIAIDGANDAAVVTGTISGTATEAAGPAIAALGTPSVTGTLNSADVDNPPDTFTEVSTPTASARGFGTFTMTAAGVWAYTVDQANSTVQALNVGGKLVDTFTVTTIDGTPQTVTITIDGANDAAVISGAVSGSVTEDSGSKHHPPTATGMLTAADVDNTPNVFTAIDCPTASDAGYGTFTVTADGKWTYQLDDSNCAVQALDDGQKLTDTFTVTSIDGTKQVITITINGADDADPNDFDYLATGNYVTHDKHAVHGTPRDDRISVSEHHSQVVYAGAGNDHIYGSGKGDLVFAGSGDDTVQGGCGDDRIYGGSGNDTINGNDGCDTIIGGFGADKLTGGYGADRFAFLSTADSRAGRFDVITDFESGTDRIELKSFGTLGFMALTSASTAVPAHTIAWIYDGAANQTIVYVNPTEKLLDIGDAALLEVHLAGFVNVHASDFVPEPTAVSDEVTGSIDTVLVAAAEADAAIVATVTAEASFDQTVKDDGSSTSGGSWRMHADWKADSFDFSHLDEAHKTSAGHAVDDDAATEMHSVDLQHAHVATSASHGTEQDLTSAYEPAARHASFDMPNENNQSSRPSENHRIASSDGWLTRSPDEQATKLSNHFNPASNDDDQGRRDDHRYSDGHGDDAGHHHGWNNDGHGHHSHSGGDNGSSGQGSSDPDHSIGHTLFGAAAHDGHRGSFQFRDDALASVHSNAGHLEQLWTSFGHDGDAAKAHELMALSEPGGLLLMHAGPDGSNHHGPDSHDPVRSWSGHGHATHDLMV